MSDVAFLGPAEIRRLVREIGLRPSKSRGQNFVIDANTVRRIVRTAELTDDDVVLEVGPGLGSLTLGLLAAARHVTAVEVDRLLAEALPRTIAERAPAYASRLTTVHRDALTIDALPGAAPTALVANLPYNVAVPVLLHVLDAFPTLVSGLVMVQREVADRLVADPGSRVYGAPSAKAAWYAELRRAGSIARTVFWPVPNVDSALVAWRRREPPEPGVDRQQAFAVVDAAFSQRRKTLRSALATWAGSAGRADQLVTAAGVAPSARAEQLTISDFARIAAMASSTNE
ncbi:MAG: 16S rRNA (adenine(1518)-N(6)/adenine(1519)-N(6))-dimethyltransferase RsmA [Actinomycetes bacterium]